MLADLMGDDRFRQCVRPRGGEGFAPRAAVCWRLSRKTDSHALKKSSGRFPRGIDRSEMNLLNREG